MSNAQKVIELYQKKKNLEAELDEVTAKLRKIAATCDERGISVIQFSEVRLGVNSSFYASYSGEGTATDALSELGLDQFVRKQAATMALGNHLAKRGWEDGQSIRVKKGGAVYGQFILEKRGWFVPLRKKARRPRNPRRRRKNKKTS